MAKAEAKTKEDVEVEAGDAKTKQKKPWIMIAVIALVSVLVLSLAIGSTVFFMSRGSHKASASSAKAKAAAEKADESDAKEEADAEPEEDAKEESDKPQAANYVSLDPPFVVNFEGNSPAKFLQINVEVMSRKAEYAEHIKKHMPVIRNDLVLLFSSQTYEGVHTLKGKEDLRQKALADVQKILEAETGDPGIEALYFTSFVMQ